MRLKKLTENCVDEYGETYSREVIVKVLLNYLDKLYPSTHEFTYIADYVIARVGWLLVKGG